jgi:hypothetical protein
MTDKRRDWAYLRMRWVSVFPALLLLLLSCEGIEVKRVAFMQMRPVGDNLLVLGHVPKELTGYGQMGRVALVSKEGKILATVDERTTFAVEAVGADVVWLTRETPTGDLSAHDIRTLAPIKGISEAIAAHPVLSNHHEVEGSYAGSPVLVGPNSRKYSINETGKIEQLPDDVEIDEGPPIEGSDRDSARILAEPVRKGASARDDKILETLDNASILSQSPEVLGAETKDVLVQSTLYTTEGMSVQIQRVTPMGEVSWVAAIPDLAKPVSIAGAEAKLVSITRLGGETWLLLRSSKQERHRGEDYYEVEHRIVRLDPETGTAAASHLITGGP